MDHRHAPLTSTPGKRGLDQMAGTVFHTLMESLMAAGLLRWQAPGDGAAAAQHPGARRG